MSVAARDRARRLTSDMLGDARDDDATAPSNARARPPVDASKPARPLSRMDYHARLRTFSDPSSWTFGKPSTLGAAACAARGWTARGRDAVRCETCGATLCYPDCRSLEFDRAAMDGVNAEIAAALVTAHEEGCAWRETGCASSARTFPLGEDAATREDFASRVDSIARGGGGGAMCVDVWSEGSARGAALGVDADVGARLRTLVRDARAHAEEVGTSATDDDDLTPLEGRTVVDHATVMALFGWSAVALGDGDAQRRCYACALCGVESPEWTFTPVNAVGKHRTAVASTKKSTKKPKTTPAALRGAAGGTFGIGSPARVPFAPTPHEPSKPTSASAKWIAATASVVSKLTMSIAGGGASAKRDADANPAPFGAASAATPLFGAPRPVTAPHEPALASSGARFAAIVVAAATKNLAAAKKRKRITLDESARLEPPPGSELFDVANEHAPHCPWIVASRGAPGWRATLDVLVPPADEKPQTDTNTDRSRNFRVVDYAKAREMVRRFAAA